MSAIGGAYNLLRNEAQALLARINRLESFTLHTPMVPAAAIPLHAQVAIERHLTTGKHRLRAMVTDYLRWLDSSRGRSIAAEQAQRRFAFLRLRFIAILNRLDIFTDVLNQRSEHDTGVWLSGLDVLAADALRLPGNYYDSPPVICFLERGPGAAIRRARTRLPGGEPNPVAVIQVPRERMIGSGIASSLVHEVGHQGAALLDLIGSLRPVLQERIHAGGADKQAWICWNRWISEIIADFWAVARLGVTATVGLMSVVSLPRTFMFRINLEDPHPAPWIRVKLSCAMGAMLYPHPQWKALAEIWDRYYPLAGLDKQLQTLFVLLEQQLPHLITLFCGHHPAALRGNSIAAAITSADRQPDRLASIYQAWHRSPQLMRQSSPTLAMAVIGQAKMDNSISPAEESRLMAKLLRYWAFRITLNTSEICAGLSTTNAPSLTF